MHTTIVPIRILTITLATAALLLVATVAYAAPHDQDEGGGDYSTPITATPDDSAFGTSDGNRGIGEDDVDDTGWCIIHADGSMACDLGHHGGDLTPIGPPSGAGSDDDECVQRWDYWRTVDDGWYRGARDREHWWGSYTIERERCSGSTRIGTRSVSCWASDCIQTALDLAWGELQPELDGYEPPVSTSPDGKVPVHIAAWFWHDGWDEHDESRRHPQAPTTVGLTAIPESTTWHLGETMQGEEVEIECEGEPEEFRPDPSASEPYDSDAENVTTYGCTSYRYERPSLATGPDGEDFHWVWAFITYEFECEIGSTPMGGVTLPGMCRSGHPDNTYESDQEFGAEYEVYELQAVFR